MADRTALLKRYAEASAADDMDAMAALRHPDWEMVWPQSGEVVTSSAYVTIRMERPEGAPPRAVPLGFGGSGDVWWSESAVEYADGSRWLAMDILEFEGDLIRRERVYFMQALPAPEWRAHLVKRQTAALD